MTTTDSLTSPAVELMKRLEVPIDRRHWRQRKQGNQTLDYVPWSVLVKCLHHRCPGWSWELLEVKILGPFVVVTGRLSVPDEEGTLTTYDAVASEPLESASQAPPVETAASSCIRRACALAGLGLELWLES